MPAVGDTFTLPAIPAVFTGKRFAGSVVGGSQILRDFPRFIRLAETGRLDLGSMVSKRITLDEINEGIDLLTRAEGVRTVVVDRGGDLMRRRSVPEALRRFDLDGRVAVVTGASSGLGAGLARGLASVGARVAVVARRYDRLAALAEEIGGVASSATCSTSTQVRAGRPSGRRAVGRSGDPRERGGQHLQPRAGRARVARGHPPDAGPEPRRAVPAVPGGRPAHDRRRTGLDRARRRPSGAASASPGSRRPRTRRARWACRASPSSWRCSGRGTRSG